MAATRQQIKASWSDGGHRNPGCRRANGTA